MPLKSAHGIEYAEGGLEAREVIGAREGGAQAGGAAPGGAVLLGDGVPVGEVVDSGGDGEGEREKLLLRGEKGGEIHRDVGGRDGRLPTFVELTEVVRS